MSIDIDKILKPYADDQPELTIIPNSTLHRIPLLVSPIDGNPTPEFDEFYDTLVKSLLQRDWSKLYDISDKLVSLEEFKNMIETKQRKVWDDYHSKDSKHITNIDIELNLNRLHQLHRNIVCGFNIMISNLVVVNPKEFETSVNTRLDMFSTELLFTYKNGKFLIITTFKPFVDISESL